MTLNIVGLSGYARSGKDTIAQILVEDYGFTRLAFADVLKDFAYKANPIISEFDDYRLQNAVDEVGWERAKAIPEVREVLQRFGVAAREAIGPHVWVNAAMDKIESYKRYVFTDVRFPNEADAIREAYGEIVRVHRDGIEPVNGHVSESAMDDYEGIDRHLFNTEGLDVLKQRVDGLADWYGW